jgi:hypothetical protein
MKKAARLRVAFGERLAPLESTCILSPGSKSARVEKVEVVENRKKIFWKVA